MNAPGAGKPTGRLGVAGQLARVAAALACAGLAAALLGPGHWLAATARRLRGIPDAGGGLPMTAESTPSARGAASSTGRRP